MPQFDIMKLDRQIKWLNDEAMALRRQPDQARWKQAKADMFDQVKDTIVQIRRDQQMQGAGGGQRLEG